MSDRALGEHGKHREGPEGHAFYPYHVIDTAIIAYFVWAAVATLAVLIPFHLHDKADPLFTPPGIKPEWYYLAMYQGIKYVPRTVGVIGTGVIFALIFVWPFVDALLDRLFPDRRLFRVVGIVALVGWLALSGLGYVSERDVTVFGRQYHIDLKGIPHSAASGGTHDDGRKADG